MEMMIHNPIVKTFVILLFAGYLAAASVFAQRNEENGAALEENAVDEVVEEAKEVAEVNIEAISPKPVGALFDQLAGETARERIEAEQSLIEQLADNKKRNRIRDRAVELYKSSDDPEVWLRVRAILKDYVKEYSDFGPRRGYLGVLHGLTEYPDEKGVIRRAVRVERVEPNTPAAKAELRSGDLILKIDKIDLDTPHADLSFFRYIFLQTGGKSVKLKILRDWEVIEIDAVLAIRPVALFGRQRREQKSPDELLRGWLKEREIELR